MIQEIESPKVVFNFCPRHGQIPVGVMQIPAIRRITLGSGLGRPLNESATKTRRSVTPWLARTARIKMQAPPRQTPVS